MHMNQVGATWKQVKVSIRALKSEFSFSFYINTRTKGKL